MATLATATRRGDPRPWPWWSLTKTAIAACALRLADSGRVDLDGPLPGHAFTLRHLLAHTAGLRCYTALPAYHAAVARGARPWAVDEVLARTEADRPASNPGTDWAYSNVGYLLARRYLEAVEAAPLAELLQREVLAPLGCADTSLAEGVHILPHLPGSARYDFNWVYHGCLLGPPQDAVRLLDGILGNLLTPNARAQMTDARWLGGAIPGRPWTEARYGLGVMCGRLRGTPVIGHTGAGPFSTCAVYRGPGGTVAAFSTRTGEASAERAAACVLCTGP